MSAAFWILRGTCALAAFGLLAVAWRAGVMLVTLVVCDLVAMTGGALPGAGFWTQGAALGAVGVALGLLQIGREKDSLWPMPLFALVVLGVLTLSWYLDPEYARDLLSAWALLLTRVVSLPIGMLMSGGLVRLAQRY